MIPDLPQCLNDFKELHIPEHLLMQGAQRDIYNGVHLLRL